MGTLFTDLETKWQERWKEAKLNESERDDRKKFMIIFAYPGVTGYLHVGHMRGYTYVDAIGRFKRMCGYNVLFPVGTHATGNGAISLANRIRNGDEDTINYLLRNGCSEETLKGLTDSLAVVEFFNDVYVNEYWKRFGFLADWRRFTCTLYPDYQKFIQWQFMKLNEAGLLVQRPYYAPACVDCGPVAVDASETDIKKGGSAETQEYTLLKFQCGDLHLIAATLRPETVYGQTNFWVDPDLEYLKVRKGDETWVISEPAYEKMRYQKDGLELVGRIMGGEMMGWKCIAPVIHREIPVLPASFIDPQVGTGLVTSVPSDAPDDYVALKMLQRDEALLRSYGLDPDEVRAIKAIAIIDTKGYGPMPGVELVEKLGIEMSGDPRLVDAKKQVYKDAYHQGRMNTECGEFAGMKVEQAKDKIRDLMVDSGEAELFYDLSEEVICRCGRPVVIKKVPDQWFIDYGNEQLTIAGKKHASEMNIFPSDYYNNVQGVLEWFRERACVRQGNWLGTTFPYDDRWIIEAISDSTLYPLYYIISLFANDHQIMPEQMTEEFFDHVALGKGERSAVSANTGISEVLLERIAQDISYWYPLDLNLGGKEHMTVHFPAFLFNHIGILEKEMWPRGIFVNWYITGKRSKISKSKGGAQPIPGAAERFGVDSLRLFYAHIASPFADVEWDEDAVESYRSRLDRIIRMVGDLKGSGSLGKGSNIDRWMLSRIASRSIAIFQGMERYDLRNMANEVYFEMFNDIRWYLRRGGNDKDTILTALDSWVRMMLPITPHVAEELWEVLEGEGMVSVAEYPMDGSQIPEAEAAEDYMRSVLSDINEIIRVTGMKASKVHLYTSPAWKAKVLEIGLELAGGEGVNIPSLTKTCMSDPDIRKYGKQAADFAKRTAQDLMKRSMGEMERMKVQVDELSYLTEASPFLSEEVKAEVIVHSADDASYDPAGKAKASQPRRPAIYVE